MIADGILLAGGQARCFIHILGFVAGVACYGDHRLAVLLRLRRVCRASALDIGEQILALLGIPNVIALDACGDECAQPEKLFDRQYAC